MYSVQCIDNIDNIDMAMHTNAGRSQTSTQSQGAMVDGKKIRRNFGQERQVDHNPLRQVGRGGVFLQVDNVFYKDLCLVSPSLCVVTGFLD